MEEPRNKYILLVDRVGYTSERDVMALDLPTMVSTPTQVLRGELLEALPEQPSDLNGIALIGIHRKSLRLECCTVDLIRLSEEEANLLLAISSAELRYQLSIDRNRLKFGRQLLPGNQVFVSVKGIGKDLPGVVWYKGELPSCPGTMFGVELTENPGQGKSDGTFKNKRYFTCPADSGVFVALDKLTPRDDSDSKSPKGDENAQGNINPKVMDTFMPPFFKGKNERKMPQERINQVLEIGQRVVTFIEDHPARGTVRYIGEEEDAMGNMCTIVGLQMDERVGSGTGKRNGRQCFTCRRNFACFVYVENLLREEDFDGNNKDTTGTKLLDKQDSMQEQIRKGELLARPISYNYRSSDETKLSEKDQQEENYQSQLKENQQRLREQKEQLENIKGQLREITEEKIIELPVDETKLSEKDQREENYQSQLKENQQRLREHKEQLQNIKRQLREITEKKIIELPVDETKLSEKDQQEENYQSQLKENQQRLREQKEQLENLKRQLRERTEEKIIELPEDETKLSEKDQRENYQRQLKEKQQRLREKKEQLENLKRQLREIKEEKDQTAKLKGYQREMERHLRGEDEEEDNLQSHLREIKQQLRGKDEREENLQIQLIDTEQQLREKDEQEENLQSQLREMQQQLREKHEQKENLQRQLREMENQQREKHEQEENLQSQLREMEQQMREKDEQEENLQSQLREMEQQLKEIDEQEENLRSQLREMEQQLKEKDEQEENLQSQLREMEKQMRGKDEQEENVRSQLIEIKQQLKEKDEQEENLQSQLIEMEQQLKEKDEQEGNLQSQLREMQQQLREKDEQEENLQSQLREMEQQLTNLQDQYREKEDETVNLQEQVTTQERELRVKDEQVNELEMTLSTAQQALSEEHHRQVTPDWVISRDEIQLTDKLLGKGGWGSVVEGKYCGCAVAVKQIHELILSPHSYDLFEREMDIASRCRHPCLLQFIGATNDEEIPLFVTELMESSLRALLEQRPLAETEVSIISLDVARALNYLHQKKPSPIIHRDISSANVLLWRQGDQWRGKVSDYGTANFMQHTMTVGPGAAIYMAPEAQTSNQTVKVDVYSFGVLLCEMCIRKLPDPDRRDQQIAMVTNRLFRALIRGCLQSEPAVRPNMEDIIEELEKTV